MKHLAITLLKKGAAGGRSRVDVNGSLRLLLLVLLVLPWSIASAGMKSPVPGSTLPGPSVVFKWDPVPNATKYYLALGTTPDILSKAPWANLGFRAVTAGTSTEFVGLPRDGKLVYGRLWYANASGTLGFEDYSWKTEVDVPATLISPLPPKTISSGAVLTWNPGRGVTKYMLMVGSSPQAVSAPPWADLFSWSGTATSVLIPPGIPTDGSTVYVRLWSQILGVWRYETYTFQTEAQAAAHINQPQAGVPIGNSSIEFQWDGGSGASQYWLAVATNAGALQALPLGDIFVGSTTKNSLTVYNIPLGGKDIHVRLWSNFNGNWLFKDYQFPTQQVVPAALLSPSPTEALGKHAQKFTWNRGSGATEYLFGMATDPALLPDDPYGDIFTASTTDNTIVATGLPLDGKDVHVRLWSLINNEWFYRDSVFHTAVNNNPPDLLQECTERDWRHVTVDIGGHKRQLLAKGTGGAWTRGVIIALHGGGRDFTNWCAESASLLQSQFTGDAIKQGYAVIALDSTDNTLVDDRGQNCGKRFDAASEIQDNIDLPFLNWILDGFIPSQRPPDSSENVFVTGISNGGYMATRIGTYFDDRITAFVPVAAGDPYGTLLNCDETIGTRPEAPGMFTDRETGLNISDADACVSPSYPNEMAWDTTSPVTKPPFMLAYHADDGVVNSSCMEKLNAQLVDHGYLDTGALVLGGDGLDPETAHFWRPEYNTAIIDFFNNVGQTGQTAQTEQAAGPAPPGC